MKSEPSFEVIVLAGGRSKRFGVDKCSFTWNGEELLKRIIRTFENEGIEPILVTNPSRGHKREIIDETLKGPFLAVKSAFETLNIRRAFVTACDYPFVDPKLPKVLCSIDYEAVVPVFGVPHYLLGCYSSEVFRRDCNSFKECLSSAYYIGQRELSYYKISIYTFLNINYMTDLILSPPPSMIREKGLKPKRA